MRAVYVLAAVSCLTANAALAAEDELPKLAVLDLAVNRVSAETARLLTELLVNEIDRRGAYQVISAADVNAMLGLERAKDVMGCGDTACAAEIAGALGVRYLVAGTVGRLGDDIVVSLKLLDSDKRMVVKRAEQTVKDDERLYAAAIRSTVGILLPRPSEKTAVQAPAVQPAPPRSTLTVDSKPAGAVVNVDGRELGRTRTVLILEPGPHQVVLQLDGFDTEERRLELRPGQQQSLDFELRPTSPGAPSSGFTLTKGLRWGLSAVAVAGLAVFAWQGSRARSLDAKASDLAAGSAEARSNASDQKSASRLADGGLVAGALSGAAAAFLWITVEL